MRNLDIRVTLVGQSHPIHVRKVLNVRTHLSWWRLTMMTSSKLMMIIMMMMMTIMMIMMIMMMMTMLYHVTEHDMTLMERLPPWIGVLKINIRENYQIGSKKSTLVKSSDTVSMSVIMVSWIYWRPGSKGDAWHSLLVPHHDQQLLMVTIWKFRQLYSIQRPSALND